VNNPLRILQSLDRNLTHPAELTILGRAALALGFPAAPAAFSATQDVDAILPLGWLEAEEQNLDFWEAQQKTNAELEGAGLYITHLFRELEIILTPDWILRRIPLGLPMVKLAVYRPAAVDLILSKMARGDDNDLADIQFLLGQEPCTVEQLRKAFDEARVPEVPEICQLFRAAQPKVLALVDQAAV
jgi:hypothetical protein